MEDQQQQHQQQQQQQQNAPEEGGAAAPSSGRRVEEEEAEDTAPPPARFQQPTARPTQPPTKDSSSSTIKPYRPRSRFLHPYYWGNALLMTVLYASFRPQWLARAAAAVVAADASSAAAAAAAGDPSTTTSPTPTITTIPYSRSLTKPSDLLYWERQLLLSLAAAVLMKTLLKRRSWDAVLAHAVLYARAAVAAALFVCDCRWLCLHALCCWFAFAALAQPLLDLDALASARLAAMMKEDQEQEGQQQQQQQAAPPLPSGFSLPMNPPRLRELVLVEESAAEAEAAAAAALASAVGSAKRAARLLKGAAPLGAAAAAAAGVGSADYWCLLVGCFSGGHHAASAAYAPAHADLALRYREGVGAKAAAAAAAKGGAAATGGAATAAAAAAGGEATDGGNGAPSSSAPNRPPRLRFAHIDASLFGAFCSASPVLAMPPPQELAWSCAVPCVLLIDGRSGKELARLPTRAQVAASWPRNLNLFTAGDVERAFDLQGIAAGNAPEVAAIAAKADDAKDAKKKGGDKQKKHA